MFKLTLAALIAATSLNAASTDQEVFDHLHRRGQVEFQRLTKQYGCLSGGDWKDTINRVFTRIMRASGRPDNMTLCVIKAPGFNAGALSSGQFIIHEDALQVFSLVAKQNSQNDPAKEALIREALLAGIAGHELAHYYNQHSFKKYQKVFSAKASASDQEKFFGNLEYSREMEFDADRSGHMLLQTAGYNADLAMTLAFEVMKALDDQRKSQGEKDQHHFLLTHPNTRERLAQFNTQNKDWYRETAELEKAFADINSGVSLNKANSLLVKACAKYPENMILRQVLAVGRHKRWLDTVSLKEQKLRVILDVPAFTDQVLESKRGSRGAKQIPGDASLYYAAKKEYAKLSEQGMPATVSSNYATLLAYSDDEADVKKALELATAAAKENPQSAQTINNLALTLFVAGKETDALAVLAEVSTSVEKLYRQMKGDEATAISRMMTQNQLVDKGYVTPNMTIVLNYSLALQQTGKKPEAKSVALQYLELYDNNSVWAKRLAKLNDAEDKLAKKTERNFVDVGGIKIGSSVGDLVEKWKQRKNVTASNAEAETWIYPDIMTRVYVDGAVIRIDLAGEKAPKFANGLGVGSTRVALEKIFGQPTSLRDGYYCYNGAQPAAVLYQNGKAVEIVLLPGVN